MERSETINVGLFAAFDTTSEETARVAILEKILAMEDTPPRIVQYRRGTGQVRETAFGPKRWHTIAKSFRSGAARFLFQSLADVEVSCILLWECSRWAPAIIQEYGPAGSIIALYPISRFDATAESDFQAQLRRRIQSLFTEAGVFYAFVNQGHSSFPPVGPLGIDAEYLQTRESIPLTSFDMDLRIGSAFYRRFAKGAFWANYLNPYHIERLGGLDRIQRKNPCEVIEELENHNLLLQVGPSPLAPRSSQTVERYQRLRRFFGPILLETIEDQGRILSQLRL